MTWKTKRLKAIDRKINNARTIFIKQNLHQYYIDENDFIINSKAKNKKQYKQERKQ